MPPDSAYNWELTVVKKENFPCSYGTEHQRGRRASVWTSKLCACQRQQTVPLLPTTTSFTHGRLAAAQRRYKHRQAGHCVALQPGRTRPPPNLTATADGETTINKNFGMPLTKIYKKYVYMGVDMGFQMYHTNGVELWFIKHCKRDCQTLNTSTRIIS